MRRGKKNNKRKHFVNTILIGSILAIIICIIIEKIGENDIIETPYKPEKLSIEDGYSKVKFNIDETSEYPKEKIDDTYEGYDVCAKLEIPSISLETNVLAEYSKKALSVCVTKYYGVEPNQIGNFCIAGHNSKTKNMFYNIKKLKVGDTLFITDKYIGKVEYEVFYVSRVSPNDTSPLKAMAKYEREVTLITCTNDSRKRVIIKAREV